MKTLLKSVLGLLTLVSVAAHADFELKPYLGLNMQFHHMKFQSTEKNMLHANSPQGNFVLGTYLTDNIAVEAGYNIFSWDLPNYQRFHTFTAGKDGRSVAASHRLKGPHVDLVGLLPVTDHLKLVASIGLANLKSTWLVSEMKEVPDEQHSKHKTLLKTGVGFRYSITDSVGLKGMLGMMDTKKCNFTSKQIEIKPRVNYSTSIGVELVF